MARRCCATSSSSSNRATTPSPRCGGVAMARTMPWYRSIGGKFGATLIALLALSLLSAVGNYYALSSIRAEAAWVNLSAGNRWRYYQLLHLANRLVDEPVAEA